MSNNHDNMKTLLEAVAEAELQSFDGEGNQLQVGDRIARTVGRYGNEVAVQTVTRIENGKPYLNNSKQAMKFPERLLIVTVPQGKGTRRKNVPIDAVGNIIQVGNVVARPSAMFQGGDGLLVKPYEVTKVDGARVFLGGSKQAMKFPNRLIVIR